MNDVANDLPQLKTVIEVTELEAEKVKNQLFQLNMTLAKKKASLDKFAEYVAIYAQTLNSPEAKNIQIMKNNQVFYQHLQQLMHSEQQEMLKLETVKHNLLAQYHEYAKKADGLYVMYELMKKEKARVLEKFEENELFDLAAIRKGSIWNQ